MRRLPLPLLASLALVATCSPALAQVESFILGPGSNIGPETRIQPVNCVTASDGSVTCDTRIENPPGTTPARPQINPFRN